MVIKNVVTHLKEKKRLHKMLFFFQETPKSPGGDFFASLRGSHQIFTCGFVSLCVPTHLAIGAREVEAFQQQKDKRNNGRGFLAMQLPQLLNCVLCTMHFPHRNADSRKYEEMREKVETCLISAQEKGFPVIACGDFNSDRETDVGLTERVKSGDTRNKPKWRGYTPMQPGDVPCDRIAYSSGMTMSAKSKVYDYVRSSDHLVIYGEWNFSKYSLQQQNKRLNLECKSQKTVLEILRKQISIVDDDAHVLSLLSQIEAGEVELKQYGELIANNDHLIAHLSWSR
jgi:hypothetical protein